MTQFLNFIGNENARPRMTLNSLVVLQQCFYIVIIIINTVRSSTVSLLIDNVNGICINAVNCSLAGL